MADSKIADNDGRNIKNGYELPKEGYCDQPYVVITKDGNWLCVMTTGNGEEGEPGQHIISTISSDKGATWSEPVDIEPAKGPESSWVMPLIVPSGRVYAFYTYNTQNVREVKTDPGYESFGKRVDTLGDFAFKYSDDNGKSWSGERFIIPVRSFDIDRQNPYQGEIRFFWGVGKPVIVNDSVYMGFAKVGRFGEGFMAIDEGAFLKSDNILTECDAHKIRWETLPEGDKGLTSPAGNIADEHNLTCLSDGSLYCTYRTVAGHNCHAYSRDGGKTWTPPAFAVYTPGGKKIKHPRAANFVRRYSNGKYTLWFHNHGKDNTETPGQAYQYRNPAWLCGGVEKDGFIYWSQPEIVLYDDEPSTRISYPDFIEEDGDFYITETQKTIARVHKVDNSLLEGMWGQFDHAGITKDGILLELDEKQLSEAVTAHLPQIPDLSQGGGFSVEFWIHFASLAPGQVIVDSRSADGKGIVVSTSDRETVKITLHDGKTESSWDCDKNTIQCGTWHHMVIIVDGGPKIITFVVDGILCDGGENRQFGWGRFNRDLGDVTGSSELRIMSGDGNKIKSLRIYSRYLRTSEAVGNFKAGFLPFTN